MAEESTALDFIDRSYGDKLKAKKISGEKSSSSSSPLSLHKKNMLTRTKSLDAKKRSSGMTSGGNQAEGERGTKTKKEKFRLSLRKKTKSPVLEACDDEFTSLSVPGKTSQPISAPSSSDQNSPQGEGDIFDGGVEHLSRSLDPRYLPNGRSRSSTAEGEGVEEERGEEGGVESGSPVKNNGQTPTEKMVRDACTTVVLFFVTWDLCALEV